MSSMQTILADLSSNPRISFHICLQIIAYAFQWTEWLKKRRVFKIKQFDLHLLVQITTAWLTKNYQVILFSQPQLISRLFLSQSVKNINYAVTRIFNDFLQGIDSHTLLRHHRIWSLKKDIWRICNFLSRHTLNNTVIAKSWINATALTKNDIIQC